MSQIEALQRLKKLGAHGFETRDASALLGVTPNNAHMILRRLAASGLLTHAEKLRNSNVIKSEFSFISRTNFPNRCYLSCLQPYGGCGWTIHPG